ncbi:MAG: hypothetical protein ABI686_12265 [Acidobacteriota bacterium]
MKSQKIVRLVLCAALLVNSTFIFAFETDQYNLPPEPLADIGDEVSQYTADNLRKAVAKINDEIVFRENCLAKKTEKGKCDSTEKERAKLAFLRSDEAVALEFYKLVGTGIPPFTASGSWMESHKFTAQPARYKTSFRQSIFFVYPSDYIGISSTVNLYGAQFGTDKIAHIFQQGYSYYKIYNSALAKGLKPEEAEKKAIKWGKFTEHTYYGTLISSVFSNADLCANFAGLKFYEGLTRDIKIGVKTKPAVLILKNGVWEFNENAELFEILLKPFISEHLNEALNPSIFFKYFGLRCYVRKTVKKQSCRQWFDKFPNLSRAELEKTSKSLTLWNGEDYGFTDSKNFITIANTCFGK